MSSKNIFMAFHAGDRGSNPLGDATLKILGQLRLPFYFV